MFVPVMLKNDSKVFEHAIIYTFFATTHYRCISNGNPGFVQLGIWIYQQRFPHGMLTSTDRLTKAQDREQDHRQN